MLLSDIMQEVLVRSGQHILDADRLEIDSTKFSYLVRNVLRLVNRHAPFDGKANISVNDIYYIFTTDIDPPGIPDWIAGVMPLRQAGGFGLLMPPLAINRGVRGTAETLVPFGYTDVTPKRQFTWDYRKPKLYLPYSGDFDITYVRYYAITQSEDDRPQIALMSDTDPGSDTFFALLTAAFLESIGRYRRAFTIQEIQVTTDAEQMVSDAREMWTAAKEDLENNQQKFYLAGYGN